MAVVARMAHLTRAELVELLKAVQERMERLERIGGEHAGGWPAGTPVADRQSWMTLHSLATHIQETIAEVDRKEATIERYADRTGREWMGPCESCGMSDAECEMEHDSACCAGCRHSTETY